MKRTASDVKTMKPQDAMSHSRKGQASVEMLSTVGLVLLLLIPILFLLLVAAQIRFEDLSLIQASSTCRIMSDSINEVYLEGGGSSTVALINLPSNTNSIKFTENEVVLSLQTRSGETQISYPFFGELSPNLVGTEITGKQGLIPIRFYAHYDSGAKKTYVMVDYEE